MRVRCTRKKKTLYSYEKYKKNDFYLRLPNSVQAGLKHTY